VALTPCIAEYPECRAGTPWSIYLPLVQLALVLPPLVETLVALPSRDDTF
jgi:hypothetical protein